jgi:hypothetical protein
VKVLIDEMLPISVSELLAGHDVVTAAAPDLDAQALKTTADLTSTQTA